jgi:hypothetical protein
MVPPKTPPSNCEFRLGSPRGKFSVSQEPQFDLAA